MIEINHRKIVSSIALFISMLLVFCLYGCRTSKKSIEKSRIEIEKKEVKLNKVDSTIIVKKNDILNKVDSLSWSSYSEMIDFGFNGLTNNDQLEIRKTLDGWLFKGKGTVNGKSISDKNDSIQISNSHQISNKSNSVNSNSKIETKSNSHQIKVDKEKDKFSIGPTFGVLVLGLIIFIYYIIKQYKY